MDRWAFATVYKSEYWNRQFQMPPYHNKADATKQVKDNGHVDREEQLSFKEVDRWRQQAGKDRC